MPPYPAVRAFFHEDSHCVGGRSLYNSLQGLGENVFLDSVPRPAPDAIRSMEYVPEAVTVYNLHLVDGPETYFANDFAVHNY